MRAKQKQPAQRIPMIRFIVEATRDHVVQAWGLTGKVIDTRVKTLVSKMAKTIDIDRRIETAALAALDAELARRARIGVEDYLNAHPIDEAVSQVVQDALRKVAASPVERKG